MKTRIGKVMVVLAVTLGAVTAHAAASPEATCQAERAKAAGAYAACEQKAVATYYTSKFQDSDFLKFRPPDLHPTCSGRGAGRKALEL